MGHRSSSLVGCRGGTRQLAVLAKPPCPKAVGTPVPGAGAAAERGRWAGGTHQCGGSCLLGLLAQVAQHLLHLPQLLSADVLCVCGDNLCEVGECDTQATPQLLGDTRGGCSCPWGPARTEAGAGHRDLRAGGSKGILGTVKGRSHCQKQPLNTGPSQVPPLGDSRGATECCPQG